MAKITLIPNFYTYNCDFCNKFCKKPRIYYYTAKARKQKLFFCSQKCRHSYKTAKNTQTLRCPICDKEFRRTNCEIKKSKSGKVFCSQSCAATYNNKLKRKSRRSKIETKFYNLIVKEFPNLTILANDKTMLNGLEVDVTIPSLNLAIEWNGIVHFKPIYGQEKLNNIQSKDAEKIKITSNKNINLIVIPDLVSNDKILNQAFKDVKKIIQSLTKK